MSRWDRVNRREFLWTAFGAAPSFSQLTGVITTDWSAQCLPIQVSSDHPFAASTRLPSCRHSSIDSSGAGCLEAGRRKEGLDDLIEGVSNKTLESRTIVQRSAFSSQLPSRSRLPITVRLGRQLSLCSCSAAAPCYASRTYSERVTACLNTLEVCRNRCEGPRQIQLYLGSGNTSRSREIVPVRCRARLTLRGSLAPDSQPPTSIGADPWLPPANLSPG
jgi:hypothetical protein